MLVWHFDASARVISSAPFGGGLGERAWVLNAQVPPNYSRTDPAAHVREISGALALEPPGTGMLTAAAVTDAQTFEDDGVLTWATVGVNQPTFAAAPDEPAALVGTINIVAWVPVALSPAALVNAVSTITEAKSQALFDAGIAGTGTATDAVVVACPNIGEGAPFAGPRSTWGARLARAVHAAVRSGARQ